MFITPVIRREKSTIYNNTIMRDTKNNGFASMKKADVQKIARLGGLTVSRNREHMAEIGRKGGEKSGLSRQNKIAEQNREQWKP